VKSQPSVSFERYHLQKELLLSFLWEAYAPQLVSFFI